MVRYLTQEWLDRLVELGAGQPVRPGATARLQYQVTGGPDGQIDYYWLVEDGKLTDARLGQLADAEVTLSMTHADAVAIQKGELDANAAFMQGKLKATGNMGKLMALLPITMSSEYKQLNADLTAETEF